MQFGYVILYVPDVAASVGFYERAFGVKRRFLHESGAYAELETGATALAFASETSTPTAHVITRCRPAAPAPAAEVAFVTDDVQAAYDHALAAGAHGVVAPVAKPWGQVVSYVRDLDGFLVELCSAVQG